MNRPKNKNLAKLGQNGYPVTEYKKASRKLTLNTFMCSRKAKISCDYTKTIG